MYCYWAAAVFAVLLVRNRRDALRLLRAAIPDRDTMRWCAFMCVAIPTLVVLFAIIFALEFAFIFCKDLKEEVVEALRRRLPRMVAEHLDDTVSGLRLRIQELEQTIQANEYIVEDARFYWVAYDNLQRKWAERSDDMEYLQTTNAKLRLDIQRYIQDLRAQHQQIRCLEEQFGKSHPEVEEIANLKAQIKALQDALARRTAPLHRGWHEAQELSDLRAEVKALKDALAAATPASTMPPTLVEALQGPDDIQSLHNVAHLFLGKVPVNITPQALRRQILRKTHTDKSPEASTGVHMLRGALTQFVNGLKI